MYIDDYFKVYFKKALIDFSKCCHRNKSRLTFNSMHTHRCIEK